MFYHKKNVKIRHNHIRQNFSVRINPSEKFPSNDDLSYSENSKWAFREHFGRLINVPGLFRSVYLPFRTFTEGSRWMISFSVKHFVIFSTLKNKTTVPPNSQFFTESFFLQVWTANNAKIASHGLFTKKYFIFPIRGGSMDCFENERFVVKKPMIGYF
jgi:hypothetical protein